MEKQKPFKLFVPPRLSSSQVSAVKPQTLGGDSNLFKVNLNVNHDGLFLTLGEWGKMYLITGDILWVTFFQ